MTGAVVELTPPTITPYTAVRHVLVVIPAHNEADTIEESIRSIDLALRGLPEEITGTLVVVADGCTDDTEAVAARVRPQTIVLNSSPRCVGEARRLGTEAGLAVIPTHPRNCWIASTDADTHVPQNWLLTHLGFAALGACAVAGIVRLDRSRTSPELADRFERYYTLADDGSHEHVHGANLGFRADAYLAAGGWESLHTGEDHDLWRRLRKAGSTIASTSSWVTTSGRNSGRAPEGFARDIARLEAGEAA